MTRPSTSSWTRCPVATCARLSSRDARRARHIRDAVGGKMPLSKLFSRHSAPSTVACANGARTRLARGARADVHPEGPIRHSHGARSQDSAAIDGRRVWLSRMARASSSCHQGVPSEARTARRDARISGRQGRSNQCRAGDEDADGTPVLLRDSHGRSGRRRSSRREGVGARAGKRYEGDREQSGDQADEARGRKAAAAKTTAAKPPRQRRRLPGPRRRPRPGRAGQSPKPAPRATTRRTTNRRTPPSNRIQRAVG